jgi:hypothetical protein
MISVTEHQKILVQTRDENVEPVFVPFAFQFSIEPFVSGREAPEKRYFFLLLNSLS